MLETMIKELTTEIVRQVAKTKEPDFNAICPAGHPECKLSACFSLSDEMTLDEEDLWLITDSYFSFTVKKASL